jgi:hypothetical protein
MPIKTKNPHLAVWVLVEVAGVDQALKISVNLLSLAAERRGTKGGNPVWPHSSILQYGTLCMMP